MGYFPDADVITLEDSDGSKTARIFSIETKTEIQDDAVWAELTKAMVSINTPAGKQAVFDIIYKYRQGELDKGGAALPMLKAALAR